MRNVLLLTMILGLFASCEKDPAKELSSDFVIKRYREFPSGDNQLNVVRALNLDDATNFNATVRRKDESIVLTLGEKQVTTVPVTLWATIVFKSKSDPQSILGTYTFPSALPDVDVYFMENTNDGGIYGRSWPASGTVTIQYDATSGSYYGEITKLKYEIPFRADYTYEEFNVTFKQVKFRN